MQFKISENAGKICAKLQQAGYPSFIVGGCVRDLLLQHTPKDWDITTAARPAQVMQLFPKNYPTGLQHGTITVSMGSNKEDHFEITTFRIDGKYEDGRRPETVSFVSNIEEDLSRRDFTINAIAYDPIANTIIDPYHGQQDLQLKIIRAVGNPQHRFQEDGLRIMRAARFAARLQFQIEEATQNGMSQLVENLKKVSIERINDEFCKILQTSNPFQGLKILQEINALELICPLLSQKYLFDHLSIIDNCYSSLETKIACLYVAIYQHNFTYLDQIKNNLIRLKFSNIQIKRIMLLLKLYQSYSIQLDHFYIYKDIISTLKNEGGDEWQEILNEFIKLMEANDKPFKSICENFQDMIVFSRKEMTINGNDLLSIGITPGKNIGELLEKSYQLILADPSFNEKNKLLNFCLNYKK